jgi:hypothetical protein
MESGHRVENQLEVIIRKKSDTFFLYSPEWHLLVQGTDLNQAYETILDEQRVILERYRKAGLEHELPAIRSKRSMFSLDRGFRLDLFGTLAKALIVGPVLGLFLFLGSLAFLNQLQLLPQKIEKMTSPSPDLVGKIATRAVEKIAQSIEGLTPERREKVRQSLRTIVRELEPFRNEFQSPPSSDTQFRPKRSG